MYPLLTIYNYALGVVFTAEVDGGCGGGPFGFGSGCEQDGGHRCVLGY